MEVNIMCLILFFLADNLKLAVARMGIGDTCIIGCTTTIRQQYLIATVIAQYAHAMRGLFFAQEAMLLNIRSVK